MGMSRAEMVDALCAARAAKRSAKTSQGKANRPEM